MKILVSAYACEPGKGSEPAVGWHWSRQLARRHDVWVITRTNNREAIEAAVAGEAGSSPRFLYVDLPRWARAWKRGPRGARLYYYLWQFAALRVAGRAHREMAFDLVHHVTFATAFVPALVCLIRVPFVWGPVGGGVPVPWRLAPELGVRGTLYEVLRSLRRLVGRYADPFVRMTWRRADTILVQNPETLAWLPRRHRPKARVCPNAGVDWGGTDREPTERAEPIVVAAGRLMPLKGFSLAIRAVAALGRRDVRLVIAGSGGDRRRLERLARSLRVASQVEFPGWLDRGVLDQLMSRAQVLLMPSLHEECGFVVVEGQAQGAVPIVLARGGPPVLIGDAGWSVAVSDRATVVHDLTRALDDALSDDARRTQLSRRGRERGARFGWDALWDERLRLLPLTTAPTAQRSA